MTRSDLTSKPGPPTRKHDAGDLTRELSVLDILRGRDDYQPLHLDGPPDPPVMRRPSPGPQAAGDQTGNGAASQSVRPAPAAGSRMLSMPVPRPPVAVDQGLRDLVNSPYVQGGPVTRILPPSVRASVQVPPTPAHAPASWWRTQWDAFRLWLKRVFR